MPIETGSPGTKYVRVEISCWYNEDDRSIHITSRDDAEFHTTVNDDPKSKRNHPSLFRHLRRVLNDQGRWPVG